MISMLSTSIPLLEKPVDETVLPVVAVVWIRDVILLSVPVLLANVSVPWKTCRHCNGLQLSESRLLSRDTGQWCLPSGTEYCPLW